MWCSASQAYTVTATGLDQTSSFTFSVNGNAVHNCSGHKTTRWPLPSYSHPQWECEIPAPSTKAGGALTLAWNTTAAANNADTHSHSNKVQLAEVWLRVRA